MSDVNSLADASDGPRRPRPSRSLGAAGRVLSAGNVRLSRTRQTPLQRNTRRPSEMAASKEASATARRINELMIVLGIDPGLANTGYGVVRLAAGRLAALGGGVILTPAGLAAELRLASIHRSITDLIDLHQPDAVALEALYFGQNVRTAFAVGQARGVVLAAAGAHSIPCHSYTPQQVKGAVCGSGRAGKDQVGRMVAAILSLTEPPRADHAADALAVAICHANRAPLAAALVRG